MALWTPAEISTALWIDFSDTSTLFDATSGGSVVTNGVGIARAEDKSGNSRHFTEGTSGNRPTWTSNVQNGLGIARYDGNDRLTTTAARSAFNFLHQSASTVFVLVKNGTSANPSALYGWLGSNAGSGSNIGVFFCYDDRNLLTGMTDCFNCQCANGNSLAFTYRSTNAANTGIVTQFRDLITPNVFSLASIQSAPTNGTAANRIKIAINGGSLVGNNEGTGGVSGSNSSFDLQIGTLGNNVLPLLGDYCELLIFNSLISDTDSQLVEGYLAHKWGLAGNLPNDHPYKNAAPTTVVFSRRRRELSGGGL
jgi:hypothetical protein